MKLLLPTSHRDRSVYFQADRSFVLSEVVATTVPVEAPKLRLRLSQFCVRVTPHGCRVTRRVGFLRTQR